MGAAIGGALGAALNKMCFVAGTQVVIGFQDPDGDDAVPNLSMEAHADGGIAVATLARKYLTQNIERLRPGDLVACRDRFDPHGPTVLRPIEEVFMRTAHHLQVVTIRSSSGIEQTLYTTAEHPVYVLGQGWVILVSLTMLP